VSLWLPRRVQAGVAVGLAVGFVALANSAAVADQVRDSEWWLQALHVTQAWESSHGSGVTVAVLDTGVVASQPDLSGSVTTGPDYTNSGRTAGKPFWGNHGTEVASLIAGHGHGPNHSEGMIGIAPAAKILSVRVTLEAKDPLLSNPAIAAGLPNAIARGITYAVRHGAKVIDLPLDPVTTPGAAGAGGSPAERGAVRRALANHVVLVAPAGDDGAGTDAANYPAAYRGVISVGAFDSRFFKAPFTSHQRYVTLTAAGQGVTAASPEHGYKAINSTSAASAMVAGVVALIKSQFPGMTPAQVTRVLTESTAFRPKGGRANGSGYGTVDAAAALVTAAKVAETVPKTAHPAGGSPPVAPSVHPAAASPSSGRTLAVDAGLAVVVFVLLLGVILAIRAGQRRRARSARLAEVRAAARVQPPAPPQPVASTPPGLMTAPPVPPIPGMPAAGSVSGTGSLPGAVASRISSTTTEPAPGRPKRSGPSPAKPTPPLAPRNPLARHEAAAAAGAAAAAPEPAPPPPATPQPAATPPPAAPYGMTSAGLPRRVQPSGSAFPKSAFGSGTAGGEAGGDLFASSGPGSSGGGVLASGGAAPGKPASAAAPAPGAATGGKPSGAFPGSASPGSASPGRAFPGSASPGSASPGSASPGSASPGRAFPGSAFRGGSLADPPPAAAPAQPAAEPGGADEPRAGAPPAASHRMDTVHRPAVSGSPPWEPAERPDSELPWNQAPAAPQAEAPVLPQRSPGFDDGVTSWDAIAEEVWPGGPQAGVPHPPVPPVAEPESVPRVARAVGGWGSAAPPAEGEAQRERPIYVWNPDPGGGTPPAKPAVLASGAPPWETPAAGGEAEDSTYRNAPPWDDLGGAPREEPGGSGPLAGLGAGGSGAPSPAAPAGGGWPSSAATPAEREDPAQPEEESGLGSTYLPAAPRLPAPGVPPGLPGVPGGTNGSYPPPTPGGTANSYLWSAKSDPMGNSFPAGPGEAPRSFDPAPESSDVTQAGESTETFGAVTPESSKGLWRLSLPTESTETFPAVPRGDSDGRHEDTS
jgi:subtilase family protein